MIIPKEFEERRTFYDQLILRCMASATDRLAFYRECRSYYLWGAGTAGQAASFNRIMPDIDLLHSFLFSAETTRFALEFDSTDDPRSYKTFVEPMSRRIMRTWHRGNCDIVFGEGLRWAMVFGTMILKLVMIDKHLYAFLIEPHNFGVLREDHGFIDGQQALATTYYTSVAELRMQLEMAQKPDREAIMRMVRPSTPPESLSTASPIMQLVITQSSPIMTGTVMQQSSPYSYMAHYDVDMVKMTDLWVWNDETKDFHTITIADPNVIVWDRKNVFLEGTGEHPFVKITPNPMYNFFWGMSEVDAAASIQDWRNDRLLDIRQLQKKQLDPPLAGFGITGMTDEKFKTFGTAGGRLMSAIPTGKIDELKPEIPPDIFAEQKNLDQMQDTIMGITPILRGGGEAGVRSRQHADLLARVSSAPVKQTALRVEDSLEAMATKIYRALRKNDDTKMHADNEEKTEFIAKQVPPSGMVKVDGHSSSPLFVEDDRALAAELLKARAINRARFIDMMHPSNSAVLKEELKDIEAKEAQAAKMQAQAEAAKHPMKS